MINGISSLQSFNVNALSLKEAGQVSAGQKTEKTSSFGSVYKSYLEMFNQTNTLQLSAEKIQLDYAAGITDMTAVVAAQEKALASLNFTVQVTNAMIDAYKEIMNMQV